MKKIMKIFVLVAAAAIALASCQKNEIDNSTSKEYEYTFHIGNADTKATLGDVSVEWTSGDQMGLYAVTTSGDVSYNTKGYITPGQPATMKVYSYYALAEGDKIYAYYPYSSSNAQVPTEVSISLPANQDGNDDMPMVSLPMVVTSDIAEKENVAVEAGEIKLVNLAAIAEFNVYSSNVEYQSEKVKSVSFTANKAIAGNFTFDLTSVDYSNAATLAISGYTDTEVVSTLSTAAAVGTAKESATKVKMVVAPGEGYTGTVVVATDKASYTFNVTKAKTFTRSSVLPLSVDLANGERVENPAEPEGVNEVTISFATTDQRVSQDTESQVWANGDVTFTNNKASSTSDIINSSAPVRLYKNSTITLEAPGNITQIEFTCNTAAYATALQSAVEGATVSEKVVTVTLDDPTTSVTYTMSGGQVRMDELTVTYEELDPDAPSITAGNVPDVSARGAENAELTYSIDNLEYANLTIECDGAVVTSAEKGDDGTIVYTVAANSTTSARTGTITINGGDVEKVVSVVQNAPIFTSTQEEIILAADAGATKLFTITSDFDWIAELSEGANFTIDHDTYEWSDKGKQSVEVTANSENTSEEGTLTLGTITFTNVETEQSIIVTVKQESSYVAVGAVVETITFDANKTQRTSFSAEQQIWKAGDVTFTNDKASSQTAVADYSNPVRLYASSTVTISAIGQITEVVIESDGTSKYKTALENSLTSAGYSYTNAGNSYTITVSETTSISFSLTGQARFKSIKVTYAN